MKTPDEIFSQDDIEVVNSGEVAALEAVTTAEEGCEVEAITIDDLKNEEVVQLLKSKDFNPAKFMDEMADNTKKALALLLTVQSNENPLKKGGVGVSYLCDSVIMAVRKNFDANEMILFDIISAYVSSNPHNKSYTIHLNEIEDFFDYKDKYYIRKIANKAAETAKSKMLTFQVPMPNGKKKNMDVSWAVALLYTPTSELDDSETDPTISFIPSEIFRMLTISAGITHGSFHQLKISSKFIGYVKLLYYKLESMKDYTEYPGATPGVFNWSLSDMMSYFNTPKSYRVQEIKIRILDKALEDFDAVEGMDFSFTYEEYKKGRRIDGFTFRITKKSVKRIEAATKEIPDSNATDTIVMQILSGAGLSENDSRNVLKKYNQNKRDIAFLSQAIVAVATSTSVENKAAVLCHIMDTGQIYEQKSKEKKKTENKNGFNNFTQREYDFNELEKKFSERVQKI